MQQMDFPSDVFLPYIRPACHLPCCCAPISVGPYRRQRQQFAHQQPSQQQQHQQQQQFNHRLNYGPQQMPPMRRPQSQQTPPLFPPQLSNYNSYQDRYSVPMPLPPLSRYNDQHNVPTPMSLPTTQLIPIQNQYHQSNSMPGLYNNSARNSHSLHTFGKYSNLSLNQSETQDDDDDDSESEDDDDGGVVMTQSASRQTTPYYYNELAQMKMVDFDSNLDLRASPPNVLPMVSDNNNVANISNKNMVMIKSNTNNNIGVQVHQQQRKLDASAQHGGGDEWRTVA